MNYSSFYILNAPRRDKMDSHYPVDVKLLEQYRILITFDYNEQRIFDVAPYLNDNFFASLRNPTILKLLK